MPELACPSAAGKSALSVAGRACSPAIATLAEFDNWVCWVHTTCANRRNGKRAKRPVTPAGSAASPTDPRSWSSFDEAWRAHFVDGRHAGLGFVLRGDGDGLVGIDIDNCCALDGAVAPWANKIIEALPTYWERSPSGRGLHSWGLAHWPLPGVKRGRIEIYCNKRYLTITGRHLEGTPDRILPVDLRPLWDGYFASLDTRRPLPTGPVLEALPEPMDKHELRWLLRSRPQLSRILKTGRYRSDSERDLALTRIAHLFRWPKERAWSLVRAVRQDGKSEVFDYANRTLARVYGND